MVSVTSTRAMNILREEPENGPNHEITENPAKNFLDGLPLSIFKNDNMDDQTIGDDSDQFPVLAEYVPGTTIKYSVIESEIPVENPNEPTNDTMDNPVDYDFLDDSVNNFEDDPTVIYLRPQTRTVSMEVREFHECVSCSKLFINLFQNNFSLNCFVKTEMKYENLKKFHTFFNISKKPEKILISFILTR